MRSVAAGDRASEAVRGAPGATKTAVLAALAGGDTMTAGDVAGLTGVGRASVSTTLSKLASAGQVAKAERGYRTAPPAASAASSAPAEI